MIFNNYQEMSRDFLKLQKLNSLSYYPINPKNPINSNSYR